MLKNFFLLFLTTSSLATTSLAASDLDQQIKDATLVQLSQPAPDFTCATTDGRRFKLSEMKGKVVLLYFFDRIPAACMTAMREIQDEILPDLKNRADFVILGIGRGLTREEVVQLGGQNGLTFPLSADPTRDLCNLYFTQFMPRTVLVRRDGSIAFVANGYHEFEGIPRLQAALSRELTIKAP